MAYPLLPTVVNRKESLANLTPPDKETLMKLMTIRSAIIPLLFTCGLAYANSPVEGFISAHIVSTDEKGAEVTEVATVAEPGEIMEYRLTFVNNGNSAVSGLKVVDPIPENTTFVSDSARTEVSATFEVSIDGGESFESEPVTRIESQADGSQKEVIIPPALYTHIRWAVEDALEGEGGEQNYTYRVVVD